MSRLIWNAPGQRYYEQGVDNGVLYIDGEGYPWNGLTAVKSGHEGGDVKPYYYDGIKYAQVATGTDYTATIEAFSSPPEFSACDGKLQIAPGLFVDNQARKSFNFSYRSGINNDLMVEGYKLHLIYNAISAPSDEENKTLGGSASANVRSWNVTTVPERLTGVKPTAHLVVDSRYVDPQVLSALENVLYGSEDYIASMPSAQEILELLRGPI